VCLKQKGDLQMPKMKTHKSAVKRYKVTATGKILRRQAGIGHLLANKSGSRKRKIFKMVTISGSHYKLISKELPYKKYARG
jgi:large subunit ribosomal protein L35